MERDILKFSVEGIGEFEVYAEPTIREEQQIENLVADIYGGRERYNETRLQIEELSEKLEDVKEIDDSNKHEFILLVSSKNSLEKLHKLANLKILGIKLPIDVERLTEKKFKSVERAYEVSLNEFFQNIKKEEVTESNQGIP